MEIEYFVSYWIQNGHGRCKITRDAPITCMEDIEAIEAALTRKNGAMVMLKYWKRFERKGAMAWCLGRSLN
ncbi:hypothetical protein KAR91_55215 [Candidatus Pacearchaeota archaeon]|nr:hypothetical protein [Candidatus Pacearchaeota archaeon]